MSMDTEILVQAGLSEIQAKIYLYLVVHGQSTPTEIASKINENRTTVYAAAEKLEKLGIISQKDRGKIVGNYIPYGGIGRTGDAALRNGIP